VERKSIAFQELSEVWSTTMFVDFEDGVKAILQRDRRFSRDAYEFVRESLDYTRVWMDRKGHVSGQELLEGIRRYALDQFGPMAKTVLNMWGIKSCEDVGSIVFNLIEQKVFSKTAEDSMEDFRRGYDFEEAFDKPYKN
jgi:uncharacterized repeat protein (TIGR04138 family)